jgi:hypothetical protein
VIAPGSTAAGSNVKVNSVVISQVALTVMIASAVQLAAKM